MNATLLAKSALAYILKVQSNYMYMQYHSHCAQFFIFRLHEEIQCSCQTSDGILDSLLMDVDFRYVCYHDKDNIDD